MHRNKTLFKKDTILSIMDFTIYTTNYSVRASVFSAVFKNKGKRNRIRKAGGSRPFRYIGKYFLGEDGIRELCLY